MYDSDLEWNPKVKRRSGYGSSRSWVICNGFSSVNMCKLKTLSMWITLIIILISLFYLCLFSDRIVAISNMKPTNKEIFYHNGAPTSYRYRETSSSNRKEQLGKQYDSLEDNVKRSDGRHRAGYSRDNGINRGKRILTHEFKVFSSTPFINNLFADGINSATKINNEDKPQNSVNGYDSRSNGVHRNRFIGPLDREEKYVQMTNVKATGKGKLKDCNPSGNRQSDTISGIFSFPLEIDIKRLISDTDGIQKFKKGPIPSFTSIRCATYKLGCLYSNSILVVANEGDDLMCSVKKDIIHITIRNTIVKRIESNLNTAYGSTWRGDRDRYRENNSSGERGNEGKVKTETLNDNKFKTDKLKSKSNTKGKTKVNLEKCFLICSFKWLELSE